MILLRDTNVRMGCAWAIVFVGAGLGLGLCNALPIFAEALR